MDLKVSFRIAVTVKEENQKFNLEGALNCSISYKQKRTRCANLAILGELNEEP